MDTIRLTGIRPKGDDITIGIYRFIYVDAVLQVNLSQALDGNETHAIDIPQVIDRLACALRQCEHDDEIEDHPAIALELIAKAVADSAMRTWQISEAEITVHASLRSQYYGLQSTVDDVSVTLHRVAQEEFDLNNSVTPESIAHVAVRGGRVEVDEFDDSEVADYYRSLISIDEEEKQRKEDEEAAAAAQAAMDIANAAAPNDASAHANQQDASVSDVADSDDAQHGTDLVKHERKSPFFGICPLPMQTTAVVAMKGVAQQATRSAMLRTIALLEQDRDSRVDGVSALYVVNALEGDYYAAVFLLSSSGDEYELLRLVRAVATLHKDTVTVRVLGARSYGESAASTKTINPEGLPREIAEMVTVNPKSPELMPWLQIESDAALDDNPVSYSLAFALDTQTVGVYSEQWLVGDDY